MLHNKHGAHTHNATYINMIAGALTISPHHPRLQQLFRSHASVIKVGSFKSECLGIHYLDMAYLTMQHAAMPLQAALADTCAAVVAWHQHSTDRCHLDTITFFLSSHLFLFLAPLFWFICHSPAWTGERGMNMKYSFVRTHARFNLLVTDFYTAKPGNVCFIIFDAMCHATKVSSQSGPAFN